MVSMTLATLALGVWGITVVWTRLAPDQAPSFTTSFLIASLFAWPGFLLGLLTVRARFSWLLFALVPVLANGMLIFLPWMAIKLGEGSA